MAVLLTTTLALLCTTILPVSLSPNISSTLGSARSTQSVSVKAPVFIVGSGHSGTTLMCAILNSHPDICCGPETHFFTKNKESTLSGPLKLSSQYTGEVSESHASAIQENEEEKQSHGANGLKTSRATALNAKLASRCKSMKDITRWAEKTPNHVQYIPEILEEFPTATIISVVRNGCDTVCSYARRLRDLTHHVQRGNDLAALERWISDNTAVEQYLWSPRVLLVRIEDLVSSPEKELKKVFLHCQLRSSPQIVSNSLNYHKSARGIEAAPRTVPGTTATSHEKRRQYQMGKPISAETLAESSWSSCVADGNISARIASLLASGLPSDRSVRHNGKDEVSYADIIYSRSFERLMKTLGYQPRCKN